jgi:hypothetical protein
MSSRITLRLMAELSDEAAARHFEDTVQARIAVFGSIKQSETKRYWKIPEWFEVNFSLQPSDDPELVYDGILSSLGEGWERHDISNEVLWAVWNPNDGNRFFSSSVRWANVERFPESAVISP